MLVVDSNDIIALLMMSVCFLGFFLSLNQQSRLKKREQEVESEMRQEKEMVQRKRVQVQ